MTNGELRFQVRLDEEEAQLLMDEVDRQRAENKARAVRALIRGLRTEHHPLGILTADLRLQSFLVEWTAQAEDHVASCKDGDCPLCSLWIPIRDRFHLTLKRRNRRP